MIRAGTGWHRVSVLLLNCSSETDTQLHCTAAADQRTRSVVEGL